MVETGSHSPPVGERFVGARVVVTGGARGIGAAIARGFAAQGASIAIIDRLAEECGAVADELSGVAVICDLADPAATTEATQTSIDRLGGIDILVNNAGFQMSLDGIESLTTEQLERTYRTNIFAMFWLSKFALRHMEAGSCIINTSSIQAYQPSPHLLDYASTKAAIVNFTKNLAQEVAERGIRVNAVAPGPIWTPLIPATMGREKVDKFGQQTPLGRAGQPAELAPAFVFLASQESSYITGEVIGVTGGKPIS